MGNWYSFLLQDQIHLLVLGANVECKFVLGLEQHIALGTTVCTVGEASPGSNESGIKTSDMLAKNTSVCKPIYKSLPRMLGIVITQVECCPDLFAWKKWIGIF